MPHAFKPNKTKFDIKPYINRTAYGGAPEGIYGFNSDKTKFILTPYLNGTVTTAVPNGVYCFNDDGTKYDLGGMVFVQKVAKPTLSKSSVTYTGKDIDAPIRGFDNKKMVMSGHTSGKYTGYYTTKISLRDGYIWTDGTSDPVSLNWEIEAAKIAKPYLSQTEYEYTGNTITPTIYGFDSSKMVMSGSEYASEKGDYEIRVYPKTGYMWDDGTTGTIVLSWIIKEYKAELVEGQWYNMAGYKWIVEKVYTNDAIIQSAYITSGAFPGYVANNNNPYPYSYSDLTEYNATLKNLYNAIKKMEYNYGIGVPSSDSVLSNEHLITAYKETLKSSPQGVWFSDVSYPNALYYAKDFRVGSKGQQYNCGISANFDIDLSKITVSGNVITPK